jgi:hypothetical protein
MSGAGGGSVYTVCFPVSDAGIDFTEFTIQVGLEFGASTPGPGISLYDQSSLVTDYTPATHIEQRVGRILDAAQFGVDGTRSAIDFAMEHGCLLRTGIIGC